MNLNEDFEFLEKIEAKERTWHGFSPRESQVWYGENRPRPADHKKVIDSIDAAQGKLPPHDVWLRRMVGMSDYSKT